MEKKALKFLRRKGLIVDGKNNAFLKTPRGDVLDLRSILVEFAIDMLIEGKLKADKEVLKRINN